MVITVKFELTSENVSVFQQIYSEKYESVEYMYRFGMPLAKVVALLIKQANDGKTEIEVPNCSNN
jgi:hypothetical protein